MYKINDIINILDNPAKEMPIRMDLCLNASNKGEYVTKDILTIKNTKLYRVRKGNFWAIWHEKKNEWLGIIEDNLGDSYCSTESIYCIDGPYKLSNKWAELISFAYNDPNISLAKILYSSPQELDSAAQRVLIRIVAGMPDGEEDINMSMSIPLKEEIKRVFSETLTDEPVLTIFEEHQGRLFSSSTLPKWPRGFKAIKIDNFYLIFIQEIQKWVGIFYEYNGRSYEYESICVSGPYKLTDYYLDIIENIVKNH